jgi:3-oxoacyl-[acyl-carrier protein] reductase
MSRLTGKVALVTGASKGIGAGIAKNLGAEGATVVVNYATSREGADRTVAEIVKGGGQAWAVQGDFSKPEEITRTFAEIEKKHGKLDVLVNNAGVAAFRPLESATAEEFHRQFNLFNPSICPLMTANARRRPKTGRPPLKSEDLTSRF